MVHSAPPRRRKRKPLIPDFFDPQSELLTLRILAGRVPLSDVNKPNVSPNVLAYFQDPANRRLVPRQKRTRGFDVAANQATADARAAEAPAPGGGGVPHRQLNESDTDFHARLVRSGKTDDEALDLVAQRTLLDRSLDERRLERGKQIAARDVRRRAAGGETSADLTLRQIGRLPEEFREKAIRDADEKRLSRGLPLLQPPQLQDQPVQVASLEPFDLDPLLLAEGQEVVTPGGEFGRFSFRDRQRRAIPLRRDRATRTLILDTGKLSRDEFVDALLSDVSTDERVFRRERLFASRVPAFIKALHTLDTNRGGMSQALIDGSIVRQTSDEQQEIAARQEATLLYDFARTGLGDRKSPTEFPEGQSIGDVWAVDGVLVHRKPGGEIARLGVSTSGALDAGDIAKLYDQATKIVQSGKAATDLSAASPEEIQKVVQEILAFQKSLSGDQPTDVPGPVVNGQARSLVPAPPGSTSGIIAASQAQLRATRQPTRGVTVELELERQANLGTLNPPQRGTKIDRETARRILGHVQRFHPQLTDDQQRRDMARRITDELGWVR